MHANTTKEKETRREGVERERVSMSLNGLLKKAMSHVNCGDEHSQATLGQRKASQIQHLYRQNSIAYIKRRM